MIGDCGGDLGVRKQPAGLGLRFVHTRADLRFDPLWRILHKGSYVRSRIMWPVQRRPLSVVLAGVSN